MAGADGAWMVVGAIGPAGSTDQAKFQPWIVDMVWHRFGWLEFVDANTDLPLR